ncbi:hypothetical protein J2X68_007610 [Streptomyces sp. 3330]|nr:hypothetical protein [Streptomyces sp. 3330]
MRCASSTVTSSVARAKNRSDPAACTRITLFHGGAQSAVHRLSNRIPHGRRVVKDRCLSALVLTLKEAVRKASTQALVPPKEHCYRATLFPPTALLRASAGSTAWAHCVFGTKLADDAIPQVCTTEGYRRGADRLTSAICQILLLNRKSLRQDLSGEVLSAIRTPLTMLGQWGNDLHGIHRVVAVHG